MTARITFPALKATCEPHTVKVGARLLAGFLVRSTTSRTTLGYVWRIGDFAWGWRTEDGNHFGERSNQRAAVEVLRDHVTALAQGGTMQRTIWTVLEGNVPPTDTPEPTPAEPEKVPLAVLVREPKKRATKPRTAPKPKTTIQWDDYTDAGDVTGAVHDALRRPRKDGE